MSWAFLCLAVIQETLRNGAAETLEARLAWPAIPSGEVSMRESRFNATFHFAMLWLYAFNVQNEKSPRRWPRAFT